MAGNIHRKSEYWENTLLAPNYVMNIIQHGYCLPFVKNCPPFFAENNASSLRHPEFVEKTIADLLKANCIKQTEEMPYCCNPLTVADSSKLRLVLDLHHVNPHLEEYSFKYENIKLISELFEKGYFFSCYDLKSGYHHISINEAHQKYLGFSWVHADGIRRYYIFLVMPFGLSSACFAFTKLMRPIIKKWRSQGFRVIAYLDDGIFGSRDKDRTWSMCKTVIHDLTAAGFTINETKSILYPTQRAIWLGFVVDTNAFTFTVPREKTDKLIEYITHALSNTTTSARKVARIAGTIISMGPAIGPLSRLFTRQMYKFVDTSPHWDAQTNLNSGTKSELMFWANNINAANGYSIKQNHAITKVIYTDASQHSYGGYIVSKLGNIIAHDSFTPNEVSGSSTYRELIAVKHVLLAFRHLLKHDKILWHSDNANVSRIINVGSTKEDLQNAAVDIFKICMESDIEIVSKWIPREENQLADSISKYKDTDDWGIDSETFHFIQAQYGEFSIDRFANASNAKLPRFNTKFYCPGSENVNAFTCNWANEFNWLCPPVSLIGHVLKHAKICAAKGVLLVPEWKSSYFWPLLTPDGRIFFDFVKDFLVLDPYFLSNDTDNSVFNGFNGTDLSGLCLDGEPKIFRLFRAVDSRAVRESLKA